MAGTHHPVRQSSTVLFHPNQPTTGLQPCIELLQVILGQLVQRDAADLRDDVLVDSVLVTELRV